MTTTPVRSLRPGARRAPGAPRPWTHVTDEAMRAAGLLIFCVLGPTVLVPLSQQPALAHGWPRWGLVLVVVVHLTCLASLLVRRHPLWLLVVLHLALLVAVLAMLSQRPHLSPTNLWAPGMFALPLVLVTMLTLPRPRYRPWLATALVGYSLIALLGPVVGGWTPTRFNRIDSLFLYQVPLALYLSADGLLGVAEVRDSLAQRAEATRQAQARQSDETDSRREAARVLHDHVLHGLHALAADRQLVSAEQARAECLTAVQRITRPPARELTTELLPTLAADPLFAEVVDEVDGQCDPLPAAVADSLAAAVREALSNVRRHADASWVRVEISPYRRSGVWVTIRDDGRGFDRHRPTRSRLGLQHSVLERLDDIGGHATIDSHPGRGTVVEMHWPCRDKHREPPLVDVGRQVTRVMGRSAIPSFVVTAVMACLIVPLLTPVWLGAAATLTILALAVWLLWHMHRHEMGPRLAGLVAACALAGWLVNLYLVPPDAHQIYLLWLAWGCGGLMHLVMIARPRAEALRYGIGQLVVLVVGCSARFGIADAWQHYTNAILMVAAPPLVAMAAAFVIRSIGTQAVEQAEMGATIQAATARAYRMAHLDQFWSDRVNRETLPLLRGVAAGELDPGDPAVRTRAAALESSVREELVLGPTQRDLVNALVELRAQGWRLQSSLSRDDSPDALAVGRQLTGVLGRPARPGQPLALSATAEAVTAVILDPTTAQTTRWRSAVTQIGGTMDTDPEFTRIKVVVP